MPIRHGRGERRPSGTSMTADMTQRSGSEGGGSSTTPLKWRFGSALRKISSISNAAKEDRLHKHNGAAESENDSIFHTRSPNASASNVLIESQEKNLRQLQALVQRMRSAPADPGHVDAAFKEFSKVKDEAAALCRVILQEELRRLRDMPSGSEVSPRRGSSIESPRSPGAVFDTRSSFSGRSLAEVVSGSVGKAAPVSEHWLAVIRDWKTCIEAMNEAFRTSLADTYRSYERDATQEMVDALFASKRYRRDAVHRMRNASVTRVLSADPQFFPRYEIRFRNYEKAKQELSDIRHLLQSAESGISPERTVQEYDISPRGDAILEFSNTSAESGDNDPVLRFRVSSHMLAETSPIFAHMFSGHSSSLHLYDDDDISALLPAAPTRYICKDGNEGKLYRMPQIELNKLGSMEILLHAAHMHNEMVPREVSFEQFVAIAECCLQYKSTSPLELVVEHRWLPQWMHKGADEMPDGLLVISYAFGLRQLFSRMSKTALLNLVDEGELQAKPWPQRLKDKIWAVRCAKVAQVFTCCVNTTQEYLRPPGQITPPPADTVQTLDYLGSFYSSAAPPKPAILTSIPRCPKGSHWCDATNLGWLMLVYNEMNLLGHVVKPGVLSHLPEPQPQPRSLAQIVDVLRKVPSPPSPVHRGGVCDPVPAFRAAINDIYNSISGLTLFDISGKSHGWALSKHREREPQTQLMRGLERMAGSDRGHSVATELPEIVRLRIFGEMDELDDLHSVARANRAFYETYKKHELMLMRNILRADRKRAGTLRQPIPMSISNAEEKIRKTESDAIKANLGPDGTDAITLRSDEDVDDEYSDYDDDLSLYSASLAPSGPRSVGRSSVSHGVEGQVSMDPIRVQTGSPMRASPPESATPNVDSSMGSPTTPRQTAFVPLPESSPQKPTVVLTEDIDEPPLTEEEAHRILWPEAAIRAVSPPPTSPPPGIEGLREKFRVGDPAFAEGLEEKTLVPTGQKQLRSELDKRVGLVKDQDEGPVKGGEGSKRT